MSTSKHTRNHALLLSRRLSPGALVRSRLTCVGLTGLAMILACAAAAEAQQPTQRTVPSIRVHGQATVTVAPDQAQLDISVITQAATAEAASDENASRANRLIQRLHAALPSASVKSISFSVNPNFRYPRAGGTPEIAGYTANNTVRLLLDNLSKLPAVINTAVQSGATSINRLDFTIKDEGPARARALAEAARQAQSGAEALAAALHLRLGTLLSVEEGQPIVISPPAEITFQKLQSTRLTPISPGTINVHADVNLTYAIVGRAASQ